jgi:ABC-type Fe3+-hydroxamate transport system substrate-binding protein
MRKTILISLVLLVLLCLCGCNNFTSSQNSNVNHVSQSVDDRTYTLDMYLGIGLGSTYKDVVAIIGSPGESSIDGDVIKQYLWRNKDGSNISVTFSNGKAEAKTQANLGPFLKDKEKVTLKTFRKLKEGSSLTEVEKILGSGTETMRQIMDGKEQVTYTWHNSNGSAITIVFEDGKAADINDLMLK